MNNQNQFNQKNQQGLNLSGTNNKRMIVLVAVLAVFIAVALITNFVVFTEETVPEEVDMVEKEEFVAKEQIEQETIEILAEIGKSFEWEEEVSLFRDPFFSPVELQETPEIAIDDPGAETVKILETPPLIEEGRTLIPLEELMENVEESFEFDSDTGEIVVYREDADLFLYLDDQRAHINDETVILDAPPQIVDDKIMIPLRFVYEQLGLNVDYDEKEGIITILEVISKSPKTT